MTTRPRTLASAPTNESEIVRIAWDGASVFLVVVVKTAPDTYREDFSVAVPASSLKPVQLGLGSYDRASRRIHLAEGFCVETLSRPDSAVVLFIVDAAGTVRRAVRLGRKARIALATGIEHARCLADPEFVREVRA